MECPRYNRHRHILRAVSASLFLPDILGTTEGVEALAKFLKKSGAFTKTGEPRTSRSAPTMEDIPIPELREEEEEEVDEDDDLWWREGGEEGVG